MASNEHGIDALLGMRTVGTLAGDGDVEEGAAGGSCGGAGDEFAHRQAGAVVHAEDGIAGETLEQPVLQHFQCAADAFLGRLEDEVDGAVEVAGFRQVFGGTQQHGRVAVVAAGVHAAGVLAGMGQSGCLQDRQRVHVGTQADRVLAVAIAQHADHTGFADAAMDLDAPFFQLARDHVRGAVFFQPELRVGVDVAANGGQFVLVKTSTV
jgi:hypothetical protein